jgi:hypothetical protein
MLGSAVVIASLHYVRESTPLRSWAMGLNLEAANGMERLPSNAEVYLQ